MDKIDPARRSANMARIKGKNTGPEMAVRRIAHRLGLRFRLHRKDLPGKPDMVFPKHRLAVFVNGCFWHRHEGCKRATMPSTRTEFWRSKFKATVERDSRQHELLEALGWRVLVVWECALGDVKSLEARLAAAVAEAPLPEESNAPSWLGADG